MFPMLWDVLPKYIDDWVDTSTIVRTLFGPDGTSNSVFHFLLGMKEDGMSIEPEGIVNLNAFTIMLTCFLFAALSSKMRATTSLFVGTVLIVAALVLFGLQTQAWIIVACMGLFSIGEMLASPKYSEFLGNIAPRDKKAMWMGFAQAPTLIGWTLEGKIGPQLYHMFSSKDQLARRMIVDRFGDPSAVTEDALPIGEAFDKLVKLTGESPEALTRALHEMGHVGAVWYFFAAVGVVSAVMIWSYGAWIRKLAAEKGKGGNGIV